MTIEQDTLDLRALMSISMLGLPDYSLDDKAVRRVGKLIAEVSARASDERRFASRTNVLLGNSNYWRSRFDLH